MSVEILKLIPTDPSWIPDREAQEKARALLLMMVPQSSELRAIVRSDVEFIDQGENFARVLCPMCRATLETTWWQQAMDKACKTHFSRLEVQTPCCHQSASLNELNYDWPAGFAKFSLEARDPMLGEELSAKDMQKLEEALHCRLRQIWAHY